MDPSHLGTSSEEVSEYLRRRYDINAEMITKYNSARHTTPKFLQSILFYIPWYSMFMQLLWTILITVVAFFEIMSRLPTSPTHSATSSSFASLFTTNEQTIHTYDSFSNAF